MTTPVVTATRAGRGRSIEVYLDGARWRALPLDAVAAAGLTVGVELGRERARELNRALRRQKALDAAVRILRASDQTRAGLSERLARRGVSEPDRDAVVATLVTAAVVDDERFARERAMALARRELGDLAIRADLETRGVSAGHIAEALGALEPEPARAARVLSRDGVTQRVAARLARRGFSEASLEPILIKLGDDDDTSAADDPE